MNAKSSHDPAADPIIQHTHPNKLTPPTSSKGMGAPSVLRSSAAVGQALAASPLRLPPLLLMLVEMVAAAAATPGGERLRVPAATEASCAASILLLERWGAKAYIYEFDARINHPPPFLLPNPSVPFPAMLLSRLQPPQRQPPEQQQPAAAASSAHPFPAAVVVPCRKARSRRTTRTKEPVCRYGRLCSSGANACMSGRLSTPSKQQSKALRGPRTHAPRPVCHRPSHHIPHVTSRQATRVCAGATEKRGSNDGVVDREGH